jgi:hypothetical protein
MANPAMGQTSVSTSHCQDTANTALLTVTQRAGITRQSEGCTLRYILTHVTTMYLLSDIYCM